LHQEFQTIYVVIVIFLSTTGLYDLSPKPQSAYNYGVVTNEIDLEGFKIIIILFFNMIFNLAGCLCLWIHQAPNFPEGYAYSIRGTAVCVTPVIH
ncbi:hypothetical protein ANCDUO_20417, partial [Ancylostoma duodenale]